MNKTTRTKLQFIVGAILFSSVAVIGCNNGEEKAAPATETKTVTTTTVTRDSTDTMEKIKGGVSPVDETKPK
jgi:hypothetical protein